MTHSPSWSPIRGVRQQGIRDFFDLAEALLDRASVQAALQRLDRPTLAMIAVAGELASTTGAPTSTQLATALDATHDEIGERVAVALAVGLLGEESGHLAPWDAVVEQLASWPAFGLPSRAELVSGQAPRRPGTGQRVRRPLRRPRRRRSRLRQPDRRHRVGARAARRACASTRARRCRPSRCPPTRHRHRLRKRSGRSAARHRGARRPRPLWTAATG